MRDPLKKESARAPRDQSASRRSETVDSGGLKGCPGDRDKGRIRFSRRKKDRMIEQGEERETRWQQRVSKEDQLGNEVGCIVRRG